MAGTVDARHPHAAGNDFKKSGGLVAEPEQRLAGFQFPVNGSGAHRGGEPIFVRHDLPSPQLAHSPSITDSNVKQPRFIQARVIARILCGAGYAVFLFLPRAKAEGMERRAAHQSSVCAASSCEGCGRLSALHRDVFLAAPGRAFGQALARVFRLFGASRPHRVVAPPSLRTGRSRLPSASSSRAARSGRRAEPRRRPGAGGTFHPPPAGAASHSRLSRRLMTTPSSGWGWMLYIFL